jgi:uroporphyrinogen decarboxylase
MTPRENMLSLYRRTGYRFAPVSFNLCPVMQEKMQAAIPDGVSPGEYFDYPEGFARAGIPGPPLRPRKEEPDWRQYFAEELHPQTTFSVYGVAHEGGHAGTHHLFRMHHPMASFTDLEQMRAYPWPEWDCDDIEPIRAAVNRAHAENLPAIGSMACSIWETAWYIRDMTQLMMDMVTGDEKAVFLLDKITEDAAARAVAFARAGVDILITGDDIGMQETIMMSLDMYREWLKPRFAGVIAAAKAEKPDLLVHYHSCGYIEPYIPDLLEAGIDILNPVQPECMDFGRLHEQYGDILSFNGTLGTQTTMPFGTPADVRETVFRNLDIAGSAGGLLVCPTHLLEPEVPWENVEAYVLACRDYSRS